MVVIILTSIKSMKIRSFIGENFLSRILRRISIIAFRLHYGILNKDVKPENFMVRKISFNGSTKYKLVMIDFALCRARALNEL